MLTTTISWVDLWVPLVLLGLVILAAIFFSSQSN